MGCSFHFSYKKIALGSFILIAAQVFFGGYLLAKCNPGDAEIIVGTPVAGMTWPKLNEMYRKYSDCDSGEPGKWHVAAVTEVLLKQWSSLSTMHLFSRKDPNFRKYILDHITVLSGKEAIKKIHLQAKSTCPKGLSKLCKQIEIKAEQEYRLEKTGK